MIDLNSVMLGMIIMAAGINVSEFIKEFIVKHKDVPRSNGDKQVVLMNRLEAMKAIKKGWKVTHLSFPKGEYLYYENYAIKSNDGYYFENILRTEDRFKDGWRLFKEKDIKKAVSNG